MPAISLTMRAAMQAERTDEVAVALVTITHPDLDAPVRLSSDPTRRLSHDPLTYGTVSRGETYPFVLVSVVIPDERKGSPPASQIVLENVASDMVALVRSISTPGQVKIEVVTAARPDDVERTFDGLDIVKAGYDAERVTLDVSRELFANEPWPSQRMTRQRFPGLHK